MRKLCLAALLATLLAAPAAAVEAVRGGLGFHVGGSPFTTLLSTFAFGVPQSTPVLGVRQWLNERVGFDFGAGFNAFEREEGTLKVRYSGYAIDVGVPVSLKRWDKVDFILRPGFQYGRLEEKDDTSPPTVTTQWKLSGWTAEFEVEWMVANGLSVSAAHGLGWHAMEDDATPRTRYTSFGTAGGNFTEVGFHVYLW